MDLNIMLIGGKVRVLNDVVEFVFYGDNHELAYCLKGDNILKTMDDVHTVSSKEKDKS